MLLPPFRRKTAPIDASVERSDDTSVETSVDVPRALDTAAAFSWRLIVVAAALALVGFLVVRLADVVVPFLVALILSALLVPLSAFLQRHRWPKWIAIVASLVVVLVVLGTLVLVVTAQIRYDLPMLEERTRQTVRSAQALLANHPFGLTPQKIDQYVTDATNYLQRHSSSFASGFRSAGDSAVHALEGVFIVVFTTLFALIDGGRIWAFVVGLFPRAARRRIGVAGAAGWRTLTSFIRVQLIVAVTDAIGIGVGAAALGIPLAVPIAAIVFIGAFVPVVGAIVGGIVAVAIALVFNGWGVALGMLGIVVFMQQLESHVLHPLLTGSVVKVHPLGIVLGVAAGTSVAGIAGAFFAVPFIATVNAMVLAAVRSPATDAASSAASGAASSPAHDATSSGHGGVQS
ncbi:AI-2E family transporter [Curtobacterium sp. Leaf261]|uniref:AI-2E family transporter n=1 Tax=Curtobacterium sp. Leaf261 TaxID=1736311 RepID=UPI0006FA1CD1|nr:AI-2E family transporter [Curtobacterium sp. Leaf261]KQO62895.1 hypothetical protein ASF23_08235 [Curtobacterium sp. Leaf261]